MKKITLIILSVSFFLIVSTNAQLPIDARKFIEVTGSAEMSVEPDVIELQIVLRECRSNNDTIKMDYIDKSFNKILKKNEIDPEKIILNNTARDYWWYWWNYYRIPGSSKSVNIKLNNKTNILNLVKDLNQDWVESIQIINSSNSDIQKYRKEVKIEAIKAAREKAEYLLEAMNEQLGGVLSIEELHENNDYYWFRNQNQISNAVINSHSDNAAISNIANIKLRYEIRVKFEIK